LALRGKDSGGAGGAVFFGNPEIFDSPTALSAIVLPHGSWQIAAKREVVQRTTHYHRDRLVIWTIGGLLALIASIVIWRAFRVQIEQGGEANEIRRR
jgi:sensor domain CHASE-containing protein